MYAITFDLVISELKEHYVKQPPNAYVEIKNILKGFGFVWIQGSVYVQIEEPKEGSLPQLYGAINALSKIPWFKKSVRDLRAFRIEDWSDFTATIKKED